jgi:hypothetical protein
MLALPALAASAAEPAVSDIRAQLVPSFTAPALGETVDLSFTVTLPKAPMADCVAIPSPAGSGLIAVSKGLLQQLSTLKEGAARVEGLNVPANLLKLRALGILRGANGARESHGCTSLTKPLFPDSIHLLGTLLAAGQAAVLVDESQGWLPAIRVHYAATAGVGGFVNYEVPEDKHAQTEGLPFSTVLKTPWWVR